MESEAQIYKNKLSLNELCSVGKSQNYSAIADDLSIGLYFLSK